MLLELLFIRYCAKVQKNGFILTMKMLQYKDIFSKTFSNVSITGHMGVEFRKVWKIHFVFLQTVRYKFLFVVYEPVSAHARAYVCVCMYKHMRSSYVFFCSIDFEGMMRCQKQRT